MHELGTSLLMPVQACGVLNIVIRSFSLPDPSGAKAGNGPGAAGTKGAAKC